jgi:hypothetical protein
LRKVTSRKIGRQADNEDLAEYLNGVSEGDGGDISCIWSRVRKSTKELKKLTRVDWWWCETLKELQVLVPKPGKEPDVARVHPAARRHLCNHLRTAVRSFYLQRLISKPDQGKVYEVSTKWSASNHMMRTGVNTRFADWRFLHRARLDCVPLNGARRFGEGDKRCRRCNHPNETLPHVLSCCHKHTVARQLRHHTIVHRLAKAVPSLAGVVTTDRQVPGAESTLRPDVVVMNQATKQLVIVDVAVVFENRFEALERSRAEKVRKYEPIANHFRLRGWNVRLDAVVVGALGSWDPNNEPALKALRISPRYCKMMRRFIISDTIRWSRDMYIEHISGKRQFTVPEPPLDLPGAIDPEHLFPPTGQEASVRANERAHERANERAPVRAYERAPVRANERAHERANDRAQERANNRAHERATERAPVRENEQTHERANDPELENIPVHELPNPTEIALSPGLTFHVSDQSSDSSLTDATEELVLSAAEDRELDTSTETVPLPLSLSPSNFE